MNDNNNISPFSQIQMLLNELNNHVKIINELVLQMMNLISIQMNNQFQDQYNQMNYLMNQFNLNMNNNNPLLENNNKILFNFRFHNSNKEPFNYSLSIDPNKTINELFNEYFRKINRLENINNYNEKYDFIYNASILNYLKEKKINEIFKNPIGNFIEVSQKRLLIP